MIDLAGTLNTTGNPSIIKVAVSNTASGATTKFLEFLAGAAGTTSVFSVGLNGYVTLPGGSFINQSGTVSSSNIVSTGSVAGLVASGVKLASTSTLAFRSAADIYSGSDDVILLRDAANTLALRNSTNAQAFNIYNTYTSGSVYERGFMRWVSNVLEIGTEHVGASARNIALKTNNTTRITIAGSDGQTTFTNRVLALSFDASEFFAFGSNGRIRGSSDGVLKLEDNSGTAFNRLQFGGTTASYPAIKRSSTILQSRLADDSDFAPLQGRIRSHANATSETVTPTHTLRLFDAAGTEYRVPAIAV